MVFVPPAERFSMALKTPGQQAWSDLRPDQVLYGGEAHSTDGPALHFTAGSLRRALLGVPDDALVSVRHDRVAGINNTHIVAAGRLVIDHTKHEVNLLGQVIDMPLKEYDLLTYFAERAGQLCTRGHILNDVWANGGVFIGNRSTLGVHVKRIRERLVSVDPRTENFIKTERSLGYRLHETVLERIPYPQD